MKKLFIFMMLCCGCNQLSAQELLMDTVEVDDKAKTEKRTPGVDSKFSISDFLDLSVIESEYNEVYDVVAPYCVSASRNGKYYVVNWRTGEEQEDKRHALQYSEEEKYCHETSSSSPDTE